MYFMAQRAFWLLGNRAHNFTHIIWLRGFLGVVVHLLAIQPALAAELQKVRLHAGETHMRLVFDLNAPVKYTFFRLDDPERIVLDLEDTTTADGLRVGHLQSSILRGVRYAKRATTTLRVVLDLHQRHNPRVFLLTPSNGHGHRLVVDLYPNQEHQSVPPLKKVPKKPVLRDVVVALDPGHGGQDPGAIGGLYGTQEKQLTLQIARHLKKLLDAQKGIRTVMTRDEDQFVALRERTAIARRQKADLFISIHADAFRDQHVQGASVYVLSNKGASSEAARWLAETENKADLIGGISLADKEDALASVLLDMSQSAARGSSLTAAEGVYQALRTLGKVHGKAVHQAAFIVLKSPDIPSLLIETGFISNPTEERRLRDVAYQKQLAQVIMQGILRYFTTAGPPGTKISQQKQKLPG